MMNAGGACAKRIQLTGVSQGPRGSRRSAKRQGGLAPPKPVERRRDPQVRQDPQAELIEVSSAWSRAQFLRVSKSFSHRHALAALTGFSSGHPHGEDGSDPGRAAVAGVAPILATLTIVTVTAYLARARSGRRSMRSGRKMRAQGHSWAEVGLAARGARPRAEWIGRAGHLPVSRFARRLCATSVPKQS
jgi:hypothetical protein